MVAGAPAAKRKTLKNKKDYASLMRSGQKPTRAELDGRILIVVYTRVTPNQIRHRSKAPRNLIRVIQYRICLPNQLRLSL